tara:strand:- start:100 stop:387 length:288 start_codon:yes stop_codon:yes gene_type:complete
MKKILIHLFFLSFIVVADESNSNFYGPNESNAYQGRLLYDSKKEDYPIDKMIKLCEPYTGIDTAQTKCKQQGQQSLTICEYKCSLHWSASNKEQI